MGTRHLICVVQNGKYKLAQYGQWDGYLTGQGAEIVDFIMNRFDKKTFSKNISASKIVSDKQLKQYWVKSGANPNSDMVSFTVAEVFNKTYKHLGRDSGSYTLDYIQTTAKPELQSLAIDFAADSLFCEWAYVLNLDNDTLEVFKGFNSKPLAKTERFYGIKSGDSNISEKYYGVKHFKTFKFNELRINTMLELEKQLQLADEAEETSHNPAIAPKESKETITAKNLDSTVIKDVMFTKNTLKVKFNNNRTYSYKKVPKTVATEFINSNSRGQYFNQNIRSKFECERVK